MVERRPKTDAQRREAIDKLIDLNMQMLQGNLQQPKTPAQTTDVQAALE